MITHVIYHLPGRKVGCTRDLKKRIRWYPHHQTRFLEVLEELHDASDQEAGDRERWWQEHFGYKRDSAHYSQNPVLTMAPEEVRAQGRQRLRRQEELGVGIYALTREQRSENGRKGGYIGKGGQVMAERLTHEQRVEMGRKGGSRTPPEQRAANGRKAGTANAAAQITGAFVRDQCPHCGLESNRMILSRWHFDRCKQKRA